MTNDLFGDDEHHYFHSQHSFFLETRNNSKKVFQMRVCGIKIL